MSSSELALSVRGVSKHYTIAHQTHRSEVGLPGLSQRIKAGLRPNVRRETFWALKDVDFDIAHGEVVGIIGKNGAGKSTLLKILSRITEPSSGEIALYGRVGSLLEVGTGFHPELTGRENVFLNGAILGMRRTEITARFDEIVEFSGVESFLDTPVKRYSSGMYVRLAFAVAAHLNPEILIVDEVLAVGDIEFQKKCLGKMQDVAAHGRTVLFVSHNMTAVQSLCSRVIWLSQGRVIRDGQTAAISAEYLMTSYTAQTDRVWEDVSTAPGNDIVRIRRVCARPGRGDAGGVISVRTPLVLEFEYWNLEDGAILNLSLVVYNSDGISIFNTGPVCEPRWNGKPFPIGLFRSACQIPGDLLNNGTHRVQLLVVKNQASIVYADDSALVFEVVDSDELRGAYHGVWPGAIRPILDWDTEMIEPRIRDGNAVGIPV